MSAIALTLGSRRGGRDDVSGFFGFIKQRHDSHALPPSRGTMRPSFANSFRPKKRGRRRPSRRGRREDRVRAAPAVSRAKVANKNAHEHTGSAETLRPSPRNGFTAYSVLSPVRPELVCHRHQRDTKYHRRLDTCHWGVRTTRLCRPLQPRSSVAAFASIASHPACRDVRNAPLVGWDGHRSEGDLPSRSSSTAATHWHDGQISKMLSSSNLIERRIFP
jgi:hypothetical protein